MSQFNVSWESFKSNVCNGLTSLQQNGELVDLTLAADSHLIKVHQVVLALASPYFKEIILSAPCQHPVIFLNNVSHNVLCLLLEYIYTGEVHVPLEILNTFIATAKALHITGMENLKDDNVLSECENTDVTLQMRNEDKHAEKTNDLLHKSSRSYSRESLTIIETKQSDVTDKETQNCEDIIGMDTDHDKSCSENVENTLEPLIKNPSHKLQYSVTNCGTLQLILNRYIYTVQYDKRRSGLRRWRCVDGPKRSCPACVDTKGAYIVNRIRLHNHPYHDKQILKKMQRNTVFSAVEEVGNAQKVKIK